MDPKKEYYAKVAETIIKNLKQRRMEGYYCETSEDALALVMRLIPEGSSVSFGGSVTLTETGILQQLRDREDITLYDRSTCKTPEEIKQVYRQAFSCDSYLMSTNAITINGELINIDGTANRVAALCYGPDQVIVVVGINKIVSDIESGYKRVKDIASPQNGIRLDRKTPCAINGKCGECWGEGCMCSQTVITRRSAVENRIKVVIVGENLGY